MAGKDPFDTPFFREAREKHEAFRKEHSSSKWMENARKENAERSAAFFRKADESHRAMMLQAGLFIFGFVLLCAIIVGINSFIKRKAKADEEAAKRPVPVEIKTGQVKPAAVEVKTRAAKPAAALYTISAAPALNYASSPSAASSSVVFVDQSTQTEAPPPYAPPVHDTASSSRFKAPLEKK